MGRPGPGRSSAWTARGACVPTRRSTTVRSCSRGCGATGPLLDSVDNKKLDALVTDNFTEAMLQCGVGKANSRTGAKAIEERLPKMPKVSKAFFRR